MVKYIDEEGILYLQQMPNLVRNLRLDMNTDNTLWILECLGCSLELKGMTVKEMKLDSLNFS